MRPLYVYRINEKAGEIEKHIITKYQDINSAYEYDYCFTGDFKNTFKAYKKNLGVVINGKYHTFNPNEAQVRQHIKDYVREKRDKANAEAEKWCALWDKIQREGE